MSARARLVLSAVAASALALFPAVADATRPPAHRAPTASKIVLFRSIGGIALGMTPKAVLRTRGRPMQVSRLNGKVARIEYDGGSLFASFAILNGRNQCYEVGGLAKRLHTPEGIHPGSSLASLKHAYGSRGLKRHNAGSYTLLRGRRGVDGSRLTEFAVAHGRVVGVDLQLLYYLR